MNPEGYARLTVSMQVLPHAGEAEEAFTARAARARRIVEGYLGDAGFTHAATQESLAQGVYVPAAMAQRLVHALNRLTCPGVGDFIAQARAVSGLRPATGSLYVDASAHGLWWSRVENLTPGA